MRILLTEDHSIVRYGTALILKNMASDVTVDESDNFEETLKLIDKKSYDLVILDILIPKGNNLDMIPLLRMKQSDIRILIFSGLDERLYALRYLQAGADGYLMKDSPNHEIVDAIRCVLNNGKYVSPNVRQQMLQSLQQKEEVRQNPMLTLSDREIEVMQLLIQGRAIGEIAQLMNLQVSTISTYKTRVFKKLEVNNVIELAEKRKTYK
jgi:two-component system, NarL family, invasion response regulator UvrY